MGIPQTNIARTKEISEDLTIGETAQGDFFALNPYDNEAVLMTRAEAETMVVELSALLNKVQ